MAVQLIRPDLKFEKSYRGYIAELQNEERYPFPLDWEFETFSEIVQRCEELSEGKNIPEGFVPSTTFWLVEGDELVGVSNLRQCLNERIRLEGGHIGLGIRPSRRGNGYGAMLLGLTIKKAHEYGISEIHIHCHKENEASVRMIRSTGSVLDSEITTITSGQVIQRYVHAAT